MAAGLYIYDRREACKSHLVITPASNNKLLQLYIIHQAYLIPCNLYAIGRMTTVECVRCYQLGADFLHMMWSCPGINRYLRPILEILSAILKGPILCTPEVCLLGLVAICQDFLTGGVIYGT